jgi:hypothetical protein
MIWALIGVICTGLVGISWEAGRRYQRAVVVCPPCESAALRVRLERARIANASCAAAILEMSKTEDGCRRFLTLAPASVPVRRCR